MKITGLYILGYEYLDDREVAKWNWEEQRAYYRSMGEPVCKVGYSTIDLPGLFDPAWTWEQIDAWEASLFAPRVKALQTGNSRKLQYMSGLIGPHPDDGRKLEGAAHKYLSPYCVKGEWFSRPDIWYLNLMKEAWAGRLLWGEKFTSPYSWASKYVFEDKMLREGWRFTGGGWSL